MSTSSCNPYFFKSFKDAFEDFLSREVPKDHTLRFYSETIHYDERFSALVRKGRFDEGPLLVRIESLSRWGDDGETKEFTPLELTQKICYDVECLVRRMNFVAIFVIDYWNEAKEQPRIKYLRDEGFKASRLFEHAFVLGDE